MQTLFGDIKPTLKTTHRKINPMIAAYGPGPSELKCKSCKHFLRFKQSKTWFKCALRRNGGPATDHRANWPACARFESPDPVCSGCGARRLDECICEPKY